ncbi:MAG TPA: cytochrome c-type biogenesis CcmF C-terminal domain-containing protein [Solirubrobacteraceae bacterium]|nr:cytochrome c-type biogenesis CcmF C-terminal domain-containing protein [Solirubrobacteraceae bacterium]
MAPVGRTLLILALLIAGYGIFASLYGVRTGRREWVDSGRRAVYSLAGVTTVAWVILEAAFLRSDFSFNVVAAHSSTTTPTFYKLAAPWSSQEGSLLLWVWLMSLWSSLILFLTRHRVREIAPYATAVLLGFGAFFTSLAAFFANPFATSANPPSEGAGLDPLLLHPSMMIHPPMLYSGYTLMTVPFAFAVGALITGRLGSEWLSVTRRFALAGWLFLGVGIVLGARWSYTELGWGGYWAWDPVENAALMPWLCITAFIHSMMIQEKRGMLKVWNVSLVLASGTLAILGTFLVRSGILDSIHAFGASTLGVPFVILLAVMISGGIGLVLWRREQLRSDAQIDSLLSREAAFLFQNLVLVAMVFVIFWVTFFPLISQAITGTKVSVGPPAFRPFIVPLALVLVALAGIGPIIAWRRVTAANLRRNFLIPVLAGISCTVILIAVGGVDDRPFALAMFGLGTFVLASVAQELWRGVGARRAMTHELPPVALVSLVRRNRRRYGGYVVHAGIALLLIGVAASSSFQHSRNVTLMPGQSTSVDGYKIAYVRPTVAATSQKLSFGAVLRVSKGGHPVTTLRTTRGFYPSQDPTQGPIGRFFNGEADSNVGLRAGLTRDIWTVVNPDLTPLQSRISQGDALFTAAIKKTESASLHLPPASAQTAMSQLWQLRDEAIVGIASRYVTHPWPINFLFIVDPLVTWIWLGTLVVILGGLIALWPVPRLVRRRAKAAAPARTAPAPVAPVREPA